MSAEDPVGLVKAKDGSSWRIGTGTDVAWIAAGTSVSRTITAAIPPVFEAYATIVLPGGSEEQHKHDQAVLALLSEQSPGQPWWLGYLDTGADDIVSPGAPLVTLYHFICNLSQMPGRRASAEVRPPPAPRTTSAGTPHRLAAAAALLGGLVRNSVHTAHAERPLPRSEEASDLPTW